MSLDHIIKDQCLTESFSFACSCWKFSLSHEFKFIRAVTLVISPKELLSTWLTEFYSHVDHSHSLKVKLRMYVAHEEAWFLINILAKSLGTNLDAISEKKISKPSDEIMKISHHTTAHIILLYSQSAVLMMHMSQAAFNMRLNQS